MSRIGEQFKDAVLAATKAVESLVHQTDQRSVQSLPRTLYTLRSVLCSGQILCLQGSAEENSKALEELIEAEIEKLMGRPLLVSDVSAVAVRLIILINFSCQVGLKAMEKSEITEAVKVFYSLLVT